MILPPNGRIGIRRGSRTLAKGRKFTLPKQKNETDHSPHSVLLSNLHSNRKKLRHLRKGTASRDEIVGTLETLSRMDKRTICHPYGPRQPSILESTKEP